MNSGKLYILENFEKFGKLEIWKFAKSEKFECGNFGNVWK